MSGEGNKDVDGMDAGGSTSSGNVAQADAAAANVNVAQTTTDATDAAQRRANTAEGTATAQGTDAQAESCSGGATSAATLTNTRGANVADADSANTSDTVTQASAGGATETQADTSEGTAGQQDTGEATSTGTAGNSGAGDSGDAAGTGTDGAAQQGAKSTQGETPLPKSEGEKQAAAREFAARWAGSGEREIADTQKFWLDLVQNVFGVADPYSIIEFEKPVWVEGHSRRIDAFITLTSVMGTSRILIEQKKRSVDMAREGRQSGGAMLSPYSQAKRYWDALPLNEKPRWIVTCNFATFAVYDMNKRRPEKEPEVVRLADLGAEWYRLAFLADPNKEVAKRQEAASKETGRLIGKLHDLLLQKCLDPHNPDTQRSLNIFCVRLVFCFYAEDTGLFASRTAFDDFIRGIAPKQLRVELARLLKCLDTPIEQRNPYDKQDFAAFPYVDGGLFSGHDIEIPYIDGEVKAMILECGAVDWSDIDPVIFGSIFESTLNPETRREGGMHYTNPTNIDKALDPLFMDELTGELAAAKRVSGKRVRDVALHAFQDKIAALKFLDPACGSGNFLTRSYTRLRTLENEAILAMSENADIAAGQAALGTRNPVKVSVAQFWGIEINDFAVSVAKTALWIAERQMLQATERILGQQLDFLPISTQTHIAEGNALTLDWGTMEGAKAGLTVKDTPFHAMQGELCFDEEEGEQTQEIPRLSFDYIMGNPPFSGARIMKEEQKADILTVFGKKWKNVGNLDYVTGWYKKAADFIKGTATRCAFVSTNSITQGEQVAALWKPLFADGVHIDFAYRTFKWQSESFYMAHVYCVIVGFSTAENDKPKVIYEERVVQTDEGKTESQLVAVPARNINGYLLDAPDVFVESRQLPICDVPEISVGNQPIDGGNYLFTKERMDEFCKAEPAAKELFRLWYGSKEFINQKPRYFLYLRECSPAQLRKLPLCKKRIEAVKQFRSSSARKVTRDLADFPTEFAFMNMPKGDYIVIPETSSERRRYVPMGFMTPDILCSNAMKLMPNATLYHFGVLTSSTHMAWMSAVAGRLEMRYRYSDEVVYNNFVWPAASEEQQERIEQTAQDILTARETFPDSSLADLYDDTVMPHQLRRAHQANDRAVLAAYGWDEDMSEADIVARLMELYQKQAGG